MDLVESATDRQGARDRQGPQHRKARRARPGDREVEQKSLNAVEEAVHDLVHARDRRDDRNLGGEGHDVSASRKRPQTRAAFRALRRSSRDGEHRICQPWLLPKRRPPRSVRRRAWTDPSATAPSWGPAWPPAWSSRAFRRLRPCGSAWTLPALGALGLLLADGLDAAAGGATRPVGQRLLAWALLLGLELEVHELQDGRLGGVALAGAEPENPRVAARPVDEAGRDGLEDPLDGRAVRDPPGHVAPRRHAVLLGAR